MNKQEKNILLFILLLICAGLLLRAYSLHKSTPIQQAVPSVSPVNSIDLNTASRHELQSLSGIGPVIAGRIIAYRTTNGHFSKIEDVIQVKGIGPYKLEKISTSITVKSNTAFNKPLHQKKVEQGAGAQ